MARALLSAAKVQAYDRDGQLTPQHCLSEPLLGRMTRCIETLIAGNPDILR